MKESESRNLYRIVKFHHAVEILNGSLHFSHPSKWDDPYETRVKHLRDYAMFAQCWGKRSMSDAMWRIYSSDHLGVRIKTTREKLSAALSAFVRKNNGYKKRLADVKYEKTPAVRKRTQEIVAKLNEGWEPQLAADLLFHKREAFDHENEVRALLYCPSIDQAQKYWDKDPSERPRPYREHLPRPKGARASGRRSNPLLGKRLEIFWNCKEIGTLRESQRAIRGGIIQLGIFSSRANRPMAHE